MPGFSYRHSVHIFVVQYNISDDCEIPMNQSEKESEQNIGGTNQNHLQLSNTATESAADSSNDRNQNSVISGQPAISSPYIHLSTCYAGKVTYLLIKSEPSLCFRIIWL